MSYELIVDNKPVGQVGTITGYDEMADFCEEHGGPECQAFFVDGDSDDPATLKKELQTILDDEEPSDDIRSSIENLINLLPAKGTVLVSNE